MQENEIQKLISIFLGLAILVSSGIFVISGFVINQNNDELKIQNLETQNPSENQPKSAFVESPKDLPNYYSTISLDDEFQPTGNLTDDFASYAAREIVKANPNGPQKDGVGKENIVVPDVENLTTNFATSTLTKINLPDWDREVEKNYSKISVVDDSKESISEYINNFNKFYENLTKNDFNSLLNNSSDNYQIVLESINQINNDFYKEFLELKVPKSFLRFHKSILKILTYQKELLQDGEKINTDPLYVYYLIESNQSKISNAFKELEKEVEKVKTLGYVYQNDLSKNNILENIFFIKKAYALFGFLNIVFDPHAVAQLVKKNLSDIKAQLKKMAIEILKDQLIHRLVYQVIRWVQGGGKPQFVTDWKGFLTDAASRGVGEALYQIYPRICQPFRPLVEVVFQNVGNIYDEYVACTLGDIVNNLRNFYNDFRYGGWIAYGSILRPENNYWGELLITHDIAMQKGAQEKEAQKSDVQASKGFLSTKRCVKGESISCDFDNAEEQKKCDAQYLSKSYTKPEYELHEDGSGTAWYSICAPDGWENTTPGALIADTIGNSITMGPIGRIVNAQDITALVSALINSGLNKLIQAGQKGLTSLFNSKETSPNQNTVTDVNDPCFGEVIGSESYNECRGVTGGNGMYKTDTRDQQTSLLQTAKDVYNQLNDNISKDNEYLGIAPEVQSGLEQIGGCDSGAPLCPDLSSQACELKNKIEEEKNRITNEELPSLENALREIQGIMNELYGSGQLPSERLSEINEIISRYSGEPGLYAPQEALDNLKALKSAVNQNISGSPQCQTPLPQL
jgi:hypothetical protein